MGSHQMDNETVQFDFKMKKVENYFSLATLLIFFQSLRSDFWTIVLFAIAAIVFAYYFIWYRKKPPYVIIEDGCITIHPPLFFKPLNIRKQEIKTVKAFDKKLEIMYNDGGTDKNIKIYSIILDVDCWKQLVDILKKFGQKN
jgi:hypothetical protein